MSIESATVDALEVQALLAELLAACKRQKREDEEEAQKERRRAGRGLDFTAPIGNMFGVAFWTEGAPYDNDGTGHWADRLRKTTSVIEGSG